MILNKKAIISLDSVKKFMFVMAKCCVFFEVSLRNEFLNMRYLDDISDGIIFPPVAIAPV
jgi:hypothetical protein